MAHNSEMANALPLAAELLLQRPLTRAERKQLLKDFNNGRGTTHDRSSKALKKLTQMSDEEIAELIADSDESDELSKQTLRWLV